MLIVLSRSWALLLGVLLLMVGNGLQGTLLGVRGGIEGFSTLSMSLVMSAYFVGFLGGSRVTPEMIRRVGHVRVFAALGSFISAILILYPTIVDPLAWIVLRVLIGFCFSGVYVTAESWLNNSATNETRGLTLSLYMIVQMIGIVSAQWFLTLGDPSGYVLFIVPSVLVSISFAPILLSATPTPAFETTAPMGFRKIFAISPLGCVGMFLMGGVFSALFGMSAVYGTEVGLTVNQISAFVATIYLGGLILQFPIGWISDRMDRRLLILALAGIGVVGAGFGIVAVSFKLLLASAFLIGGMSNPLYALLVAHTNDHLSPEHMAGSSGRLMFINGVGAIAGPLITGVIMETLGAPGYFVFLALLMLTLATYAAYRMTQRAGPPPEDIGSYIPVAQTASPVAMEVMQDVYVDNASPDPHLR